MALGKGLHGFRLLAIGLMVAAPGAAYAHAGLVKPAPRAGTVLDATNTTLKFGPCGGTSNANLLPKGQPVAQYDAGATIPVVWSETVSHQGCFQFRLSSTGNDTNFQLLTQINDPAGGAGTTYDAGSGIKLPDGVTCQNCTLQMLQLMNGASPCTANQDPATASQGLYYSCADIRIGDFPDAGAIMEAGAPDDDGGESSSSSGGGSTTTPTDGGGKTSSSSGNGATGSRTLRQSDDGGCNVADGTTSGISFFVSAGMAVMALARRRKKNA